MQDEFNESNHPKVIVYLSLLLKLLTICQTPACGAAIDQENITKTFNGACLTLKYSCNNGHDFVVGHIFEMLIVKPHHLQLN